MAKYDDAKVQQKFPADYVEPPFMDVHRLKKDGLEMHVKEKFLYGPNGVPGYLFAVDVDSQEAGTFIALLTEDYDTVGELGTVGIELNPAFEGQDLPTRTVELIAPILREHNLGSVMIAFDQETHPIRRACENLGAKLLDTITGENGNRVDRYVRDI